MAESVVHTELEPQKRRSTRIVQAVPLTVTGVDALGRPFQERTSTLIVNCHGCRYQSKHYVLKNMWVTLEVPHPETGRDPRQVRARVTWIQRPRTVRELFQIGVELEIPGNVWGIAFPPADWFAFPEGPLAEIPSPAAQAEAETDEWPLPPATPAAETREDNLHVLPSPAGASGDATLQLARQVARLVAEAKQQIERLAREATERAASVEVRPLLAALNTQLREAAEKSVEAAMVARTEPLLRETETRIAEAQKTALASLGEELDRKATARLEETAGKLTAEIEQAALNQQAAALKELESRLQTAAEELERLRGQAVAGSGSTQEELEQFRKQLDAAVEGAGRRVQEKLDARAEEATVRLEKLEKSARKLRDEIDASVSAAQEGWRARLDADLGASTARWNEKVETSLEAAARQAVERMGQQARTTTQTFEQELVTRTAALRQSFEQATAEAESALGTLRTALGKETTRAKGALAEIEQAAGRIEDHRARLEAMRQATTEELDQRFRSLVETQTRELDQHAERAVAGMAERLQPVLEAAGQQTLGQLAAQLEQQFQPHLERAGETLRRLEGAQAQADEALATYRERLHEVSGKSVQETVNRMQQAMASLEREFSEAARAATAKWLGELETKATETQHTTFEALYKSAEWYEKKVATQMQASLDRGLEQASHTLREKAGEMSGTFASELDHYSRSYVEHSQEQMDEAVKEALERSRALMGQAAETTAAGFGDEIRQAAQREYDRLQAALAGAYDQTAQRVETLSTQMRAKVDGEARQFFVEFHKGMSEVVQQGVAKARQDLAAQAAPLAESLRAEREAQEKLWQEELQRTSGTSVEEYKKRLENVSNSWILATVTTLSKQSQEQIDKLAVTAEERLRQTASQVFARLGDTLRQKLAELATGIGGVNQQEKK
ncbi:MAG TPA: hypothetical protein VI699_06510 [Candidatus Acidoferrales bacterium]|nr:hypothetical protein [Candidatus Acidoferrales bacterium]